MIKKNGNKLNKLIELRKQAKKSQSVVAIDLGISRSFYGMIEQGERNPTLALAHKIASYFNADLEEIFFENNCNEIGQYKAG